MGVYTLNQDKGSRSIISEAQTSEEDLISFIRSEVEKFEFKTESHIDMSFSPVLKPSPNITNISEIYQDKGSTLSLTSRQLNFNVSSEIISEEPEEEEERSNKTLVSEEDPKAKDSVRPKKIAKQIYDQDFLEVGIDKYTAYLGTNNPFQITVCEELMNLFQPWPNTLLRSLRKFCSKVYLIGESTQIDQVLEIFAKSWTSTYPGNSIGDYKSIHIVCFALLILNSDLHNEQNIETKFTKDEFVQNTWDALKEDETANTSPFKSIESTLKSFYDSIHSEPLELLKLNPAKLRKNNNSHKSRDDLRALSTTSSRTPTRVDSTFSNVSIRSNRNSRRLSSISTMSLHRESTAMTSTSDVNYQVDYQKDKFDDRLEVLGPPWLIEGLLKSEGRSAASGKSKSLSKFNWFSRITHTKLITSELDIYNIKDWKQSIVIIQKGLLKQYSFGSTSDRRNFVKTKSDRFVNTVLTYNLYSATASLVDDQIISNSLNKTNGVAWVLTIPNLLSNDYTEDKNVVYYAPSIEVAHSFIETCNFWAARITSIPSTDDKIVTNSEFGWSDEILTMNHGLQSVTIKKWECLLSIESSFIPSTYSLNEQFDRLKEYLAFLESAIEEHNQILPVLKRVWSGDELEAQRDLVMTNWNEKYVYLYKQHHKYKIYLDSLALAISFKASKI